MGRETYLADLYRQSVQALTQNRTEWMGLLSSVSKYYKMSFDKNVLIYVQRPDAGLLATKMGWEKQTGRYLKAGSKGIGVVDMNNPKATLAYYFDLADTRGDYEGFRRAMSAVWSLERQYQPEILDRFHKQFGTDENSIENCLCQLVGMQADAFFEKYLSCVEVKDENSVLYGLPAGAVQAEFAKLVSDSAAYIVFKKCGIKTEIFEETGAFENISHFGSLELFMGLGYYTCAIARPVLSEIHKQIEEIKEERSQRYEPRTVSETGIHERGGRDAVSEPSDIREQGYDLRPTGMFGRRWKDYMKSKHPQRLSELIALGQINELIAKVDKEAEAKKETLIQQLLEVQPMPKTEDMLERAGHMEMITRQAEEIILHEVVYQLR